ncbi:RNA polymerase sigma factor SigM [Rhodococcus chondri]|uniref:RNA polymerase sigma factor SigM n=1 Tax=Rhodococcus chondri TaxID=3065941 RepID=A0ABU7JNX3_9NOCA|nr:RNA polymerase sigma factor SigM [Rhodococcus sp. CC-R104]MEE2031730.1 RNA polymerase sigma factor SigM [Rhodococcus sp. CC-R104]
MRIFGGIAKIAVSDADLLSAHAAGDRHAFSTLLSRHYDHLWQVARRTSYSQEDAADALQEALLSVHRMAGTFREDAAVRSWLHTIVVNACLDRIRRNKVRPTVPLFDDDVEDPHHQHSHLTDVEIALDIESALFALPPDQRAAVVAVDVEGYPVREAARRLGVPEGTVKSRCARGRGKLAVLLADLRDGGNRT